jgi:site-specific DNA recombinase
MRVDAYVRVSKVAGRSGESFASPSEQKYAIEAWAARNGCEVAAVWEELDESGGRQDRPKLLEAIRRAETGQTDGVVVAYLDRFFRSQLYGLQAVKRLTEAGRFFASVDGVDTRDDRSALMLGIRLAIAEDERERRRRDFDSAVERAVARGIHRCPVAPFGYRKREDRLLEKDPKTARLVHELFERAARGESWAALARWMEREGAVTRYGATTWTARAVKDMVRNRVYLGEARNGEHVNAHAHPPLTDELTWQRAQRVGRSFAPARSEEPALLSGLIRCAGCRHGMASYFDPKGRGRTYRCRKRYAAGECAAPAFVKASVIEPYVEQLLFEAVGQVRPETPDDPTAEQLELAEREREVELIAFRDDPILVAQLGAEDFAAGVKVRREAFEAARDRRLEHVDRTAASFDPIELQALWPSRSVMEKREILSAVFDAIFVLRGRSTFGPIADYTRAFLRGDGPIDLPRRGARRGEALRPLGELAA